MLVVDNLQFLFFLREPEDGQKKVLSAAAINPTGAKDKVRGSGGSERLIAGQFARAVDTQRPGGISFDPGARSRTVINVIGGEMDDRNTHLGGQLSKNAWSIGI